MGGDMVPLGAVATVETRTGAERVPRYNLFPTAEIFGAGAGISSGEAIALVETIAGQVLPQGFGIEWTDLSYQETVTEDGTLLGSQAGTSAPDRSTAPSSGRSSRREQAPSRFSTMWP